MRTMLFVLTMAFGLALAGQLSAAPYCDGFNAGYKKGYCDAWPARCASARKSWCPRPRDTESSYDRGFERGVKDGGEDGETERAKEARCSANPDSIGCRSSLPDVGSGEGRDRREDNLQCRPICSNDIRTGEPTCTMQC